MVKAAIREQPWCAVCGHRGSPDNPLTGDHIRALADGGLSTPSNIQVLCLSHNSSKGAQRKGKSARQKLILDPDAPTVG
jgi:5-methylcytosine-specific restriction endonuclease McrA